MSAGVIIVAGGKGTRLGGAIPKQFIDLAGQTALQMSVAAFDRHPRVSHLVVVLPANMMKDAATWVGATTKPCAMAAGGARRQDSVRNGLAALEDGPGIVLVHDAARPFVDAGLITRVVLAAEDAGAALPAVQARDTVKRAAPQALTVVETIAREHIWLAQTPQGFNRSLLASVMAHGDDTDVTDEAMLLERAGHAVRIVPGDESNVKITTPADLEAARARLAGSSRVGTGYDLHRLVDGRPLVLAGVTLSAARGPLGHSDGDVLCHAITDAILGAAAAGDIGRHFSNTDPRWKDAPGLDLLARAVAIVAETGYRVTSVDATVILETPKLSPVIDELCARLAAALGCDRTAVSVKGKTNEGVDAVGRGEAIAAHAVAVLQRGRAS